MPSMQQSNLPDKIRLVLLEQRSGKPVAGVPIQLEITASTPQDSQLATTGLLVSNHAGYVSFNLKSRKRRMYDVVDSIEAVIPSETPTRIDLLEKLGLTRVLGSLPNDSRDNATVIPVSLAENLGIPKLSNRGLTSIEDPDIGDWLVAPGSFGMDAVQMIGEDGCEVLLPSHAVERVVRLHRVERTTNTVEFPIIQQQHTPWFEEQSPYLDEGSPQFDPNAEPNSSLWPDRLYYRTGLLRRYELLWIPINHGLGSVLYSLTLAPCEAVRLAVIDWSRTEDAARMESTRLSDDLTHSMRRDRSVEEVVNAVLEERQSGESFLGGMAGVGGYGGGLGGGGGAPSGGSGTGGSPPAGGGQGGQSAGQNWGITGSHSLGYAMANSSGNRDVDVETAQEVIDEIAQASQLVRDLRSTVIVQSSQAEREAVQTRIVRNHNHSHALTILYYEVVRHYLIRTMSRSPQRVIFIRFPILRFDEKTAYKHRRLLASHLREPELVNHFDALVANVRSTGDELSYLTDAEVSHVIVDLTVAEDAIDNLDRLSLLVRSSTGATPREVRFERGALANYASSTFTLPISDTGLRYSHIVELGLRYIVEGDGEYRERAAIQRFNVRAALVKDGVTKIFDLLASNEYHKFEHTGDFWRPVNRKVDSTSLTAEDAERRRQIAELLDHLADNRHHYSALIWLHESPHERAARFANYHLDGKLLLDQIENRPISVEGDFLVFPWPDPTQNRSEPVVLAERIVSLPTRGAFAEAKLSHCNASEVIDDTRFWDWQVSPCPDEPTAILPIATGTRRSSVDATPSPLPASGVNITTPQTAPEPFGLREAMELLRTPEVFRNMSGIENLGSLLEKLVEVAGEVEKARIGATTELATAGGDSTAAGTARGPSPTATGGGSSRERMSQVQRGVREIQRATERGQLSEDQARDLTYRTLENTFAGGDDSGRLLDQAQVRDLVEYAAADGSDVELSDGISKVSVQRKDAAPVDSSSHENLDSPVGLIPVGKGMFTQSALTAEASDANAMAVRAREVGLSWIAIGHAWSNSGRTAIRNTDDELRLYAEALRREQPDIALYVWGYPHPDQTVSHVSALIDAAVVINADGVIVDPELPYKWSGSSQRAVLRRAGAELMDELVGARALGLSIGVTSYGRAHFHRNMPWTEFAAGADYGMPQIYEYRRGGTSTFSSDYPTRCMDDWSARGFNRLIPLSAAFDRSSEETVELLSRTPVPDAAIGWFRWITAGYRAGVWNAIRDYSVPE